MRPVTIPIVTTLGYQQALRYVVTDTLARFWTGSEWASQQKDARLFGSHYDAVEASRLILFKQFRGMPVYQKFVVPLEMEVFAGSEVLPEELKNFAKKAVKLSALYADHGTGPRAESLVLPRLNWGKLTHPMNSEREHTHE